MPLTDKQQRFIEEYLVDLNATQAAIRAGYSRHTAAEQGCQLLGKKPVAEAIAEAQRARSERTGITADRVLTELARLGFSNMADYMRPSPDGEPYLSFADLTRDQTAALAEVTVDRYMDGRGDEAREVKRTKFKLADKRAALVDIGRHLGMFKDKVEVTGKNGGPIETKERSSLEIAKAIMAVMARAQAEAQVEAE